MYNDLDFLKFCFKNAGRLPSLGPHSHRHYQFAIFFKSLDDSSSIHKIVVIDKNCDVKTISVHDDSLKANYRVRQLSCIRVYWDEEEGYNIECEQFHKGEIYHTILDITDEYFETKDLSELIKKTIEDYNGLW
jgi:hypothetical protein